MGYQVAHDDARSLNQPRCATFVVVVNDEPPRLPVATLHQWRYLGQGPAAFRSAGTCGTTRREFGSGWWIPARVGLVDHAGQRGEAAERSVACSLSPSDEAG